MRILPPLAILLGLAGLIPFLGTGLVALTEPGEWGRLALVALTAYAAVILAFLGGVHWGLALEDGVKQTAATQRVRFVGGVVPSLVGWVGLLVGAVGFAKTGLLVEAAGFVGVTIAEARGTRAGLVPRAYMGLRWVLSLVVIVCLVSVVIVLALGGRVTW